MSRGTRRLGAFLALAAMAISASSCGSGSNAPPIAVSAAPLAAVSAPPVNGMSVAFALAGAPQNLAVSTTSVTSAPSGVPAPSALVRAPQSIAGAVPFLYVVLEVNQTVSASVFVNEVITLAGLPLTATYFVEVDDPSLASPKLVTVPGTVSGSTATFVNANGSGGSGFGTLQANHVYVFQSYYVASSTSSPSPGAGASPTASPTPTPGPGVLFVTPASVQLNGTGASNAASAAVQEGGYSGSFSETDTCSGIATVTTSNAIGPAATYAVTGVGAGSCSATFSDANGQHAALSIGVTTSGFGVDARARGGAQ